MSTASTTRKGRGKAARCRGIALALALVTAFAAAATEPEIRPWVDGDAPIAPHLSRGAWTLVMFWSITCEICAAETPVLNAFHEEERAREGGVRLLGVSIDGLGNRAEAARWMTRHEMGFPSLIGDLTRVAGYFSGATKEQFLGTPTFMIFDPDGQLVGVNAGPVRVQAVREFVARNDSTLNN